MIVPMKKILLVTQKKDASQAVSALKGLGVLHPELERKTATEYLQNFKKELERLRTVVQILVGLYPQPQRVMDTDVSAKAQEVLFLEEKIRHLRESLPKRKSLIEEWFGWGDFDPEDFKILAAQGIYAQLTEIPAKEIDKISDKVIIQIITQAGSTARCLLISRQKIDLPFKMPLAPPMSLKRMRQLKSEEESDLAQAQQRLQDNACYLKHFQKVFEHRAADLRFQETLHGMGEKEGLAYLKGYCPREVCGQIESAAQKEKWALLISDPDSDDKVPTLLRNPKWVEIIKPVFQFMNSIPGYRELDVSLFFLLFLGVFFGILIGDAGYGILFVGLTAAAHKKMRPKIPSLPIFCLIYFMSFFAIIWGFLTGTFFGTKLFGAFVKPLMPWLTINKNVQLVCFVLGAVHLSIAHIWRAINRINSVVALAEVGWLLIVWGCFFFTRMLILNEPLPNYINVILISGPALVILFNQPRKNIFARVGLGLGDFLLNVMSFFGDVVSYIRLFAVGLAGVSVADAFNQMALAAGFNNIFMGLIAVCVLLIGHALNMVLACFGVLVHGIRLNLLEFSAHLGMEWTGEEYHPLSTKS